MNPEDFNYFQSRVSRFITGTSSRNKFGIFGSPKITRLSGIIPKRSLPSRIFSRSAASADDSIESSGRGITALGRVALDLEVINNNLDRIRQVIEQDYKNTQDTNRKEVEDYRKRIANRGRIFGKKELGDKKSDVLGSVKKYVGSFFSGVGGSIRALAAFKLIQGLLSGDPSKIIGPLIGIGLTYLPAIATGIAGAVATSLVGKLFGGGAATRAAASAAPAAAGAGASRFAGARGLAGRAALVGGGLALANSIFNRPQEDTQQQRLEELTQEQKGLTDPQNLVSIPQDDLKRFENLNKRFEAALDFLMGKGGRQGGQQFGATAAPSRTPSSTDLGLTGNAPVADVSKDTEFITEVKKLASEVGVQPSQLLSLYNAESSLNPSTPTPDRVGGGLFQLRDTAAYGFTDQQWLALSRADQVRVHRKYLETLGVKPGGRQGFENVVMANIRPASMGQSPDAALYSAPSSAYANNKNIDILYGNADGIITLREYSNFIAKRGGSSTFAQYNTGSVPVSPVSPSPSATRRTSLPAPQRQAPNVTLVPMNVGGDSAPSSAASGATSNVPSINTTYPDNFLAMYSRLLYQVV